MIFSFPTLWPVRYFPPWEKRSPLRLKFMDNHRVTPVPELAIKVPLHRWFLGEYGTMYGIRMYRCIYIYTFPFVTIFYCIMIVYMLDTLIVWYDLCLPTLALSSPPKKNIVTVRESGNHRPVISTLMDQEGLLPPVRFGEFTAMYGKSEAKECSGNPGSVHEKTRGTAESNLVTSGRTKSLLVSRSYHNTRIPGWFFGEDVNDCECIYMYLFWGWFGDGWRGTTCVFF